MSLARAVLFAHNVTERYVWAADSFEGLPPGNEQQYPADVGSEFHKYKELAVTLEQVQDNFRAYGLLDEQAKFLKGWFKDTYRKRPSVNLRLYASMETCMNPRWMPSPVFIPGSRPADISLSMTTM